jgi:hypothetical protein
MKRDSAKIQDLSKSFIVRVYRINGEGSDGLVGVVETVTRGFTGFEELWEILASAGKRGKGRKPKGGSHVRQV